MKLTQSFGFGVNLRFIHSLLAPFVSAEEQGWGGAIGISFDIGLLFRDYVFGRRVSAGLNLSNLGPISIYFPATLYDQTTLRLLFAKNYRSGFNSQCRSPLNCDKSSQKILLISGKR